MNHLPHIHLVFVNIIKHNHHYLQTIGLTLKKHCKNLFRLFFELMQHFQHQSVITSNKDCVLNFKKSSTKNNKNNNKKKHHHQHLRPLRPRRFHFPTVQLLLHHQFRSLGIPALIIVGKLAHILKKYVKIHNLKHFMNL